MRQYGYAWVVICTLVSIHCRIIVSRPRFRRCRRLRLPMLPIRALCYAAGLAAAMRALLHCLAELSGLLPALRRCDDSPLHYLRHAMLFSPLIRRSRMMFYFFASPLLTNTLSRRRQNSAGTGRLRLRSAMIDFEPIAYMPVRKQGEHFSMQ